MGWFMERRGRPLPVGIPGAFTEAQQRDLAASMGYLLLTGLLRTSTTGLQVQAHPTDTGRKLHHFLRLHVLETPDASSTITDAENATGFLTFKLPLTERTSYPRLQPRWVQHRSFRGCIRTCDGRCNTAQETFFPAAARVVTRVGLRRVNFCMEGRREGKKMAG